VARLARKKLGASAKVVGVDVSGPMLAVARGIHATIDWREGNATALPVTADEQFSIVTCRQGLQFVPDKAGAVREMRRVPRAGGHVAVGTWLSIEQIPFVRDLDHIARRQLGLCLPRISFSLETLTLPRSADRVQRCDPSLFRCS
jgi:ubiquinone/menaquinone biosynthesis C-methylase UbiE